MTSRPSSRARVRRTTESHREAANRIALMAKRLKAWFTGYLWVNPKEPGITYYLGPRLDEEGRALPRPLPPINPESGRVQ